jgi:hypothetical protein
MKFNLVLHIIHSSMILQPFVGPWLLLKFRNLFYTDGRTPWTSDRPVARPLPTHRTTQTQNKRTHRHPCLEWDSKPRPQCWSGRRLFMPQTARLGLYITTWILACNMSTSTNFRINWGFKLVWTAVGACGSVVCPALCYKPEGRRFESWMRWIFQFS